MIYFLHSSTNDHDITAIVYNGIKESLYKKDVLTLIEGFNSAGETYISMFVYTIKLIDIIDKFFDVSPDFEKCDKEAKAAKIVKYVNILLITSDINQFELTLKELKSIFTLKRDIISNHHAELIKNNFMKYIKKFTKVLFTNNLLNMTQDDYDKNEDTNAKNICMQIINNSTTLIDDLQTISQDNWISLLLNAKKTLMQLVSNNILIKVNFKEISEFSYDKLIDTNVVNEVYFVYYVCEVISNIILQDTTTEMHKYFVQLLVSIFGIIFSNKKFTLKTIYQDVMNNIKDNIMTDNNLSQFMFFGIRSAILFILEFIKSDIYDKVNKYNQLYKNTIFAIISQYKINIQQQNIAKFFHTFGCFIDQLNIEQVANFFEKVIHHTLDIHKLFEFDNITKSILNILYYINNQDIIFEIIHTIISSTNPLIVIQSIFADKDKISNILERYNILYNNTYLKNLIESIYETFFDFVMNYFQKDIFDLLQKYAPKFLNEYGNKIVKKISNNDLLKDLYDNIQDFKKQKNIIHFIIKHVLFKDKFIRSILTTIIKLHNDEKIDENDIQNINDTMNEFIDFIDKQINIQKIMSYVGAKTGFEKLSSNLMSTFSLDKIGKSFGNFFKKKEETPEQIAEREKKEQEEKIKKEKEEQEQAEIAKEKLGPVYEHIENNQYKKDNSIDNTILKCDEQIQTQNKITLSLVLSAAKDRSLEELNNKLLTLVSETNKSQITQTVENNQNKFTYSSNNKVFIEQISSMFYVCKNLTQDTTVTVNNTSIISALSPFDIVNAQNTTTTLIGLHKHILNKKQTQSSILNKFISEDEMSNSNINFVTLLFPMLPIVLVCVYKQQNTSSITHTNMPTDISYISSYTDLIKNNAIDDLSQYNIRKQQLYISKAITA